MDFFDMLGATLVNGDIPLKFKQNKQKEIKSRQILWILILSIRYGRVWR